MSTVEFSLTNNAESCLVRQDQWVESRGTYRCHVLLIKEEDGGFSAVVLNLPGAGSCGDTEEESLLNVREALHGVIRSYLDAGKEIPWVDSLATEIPADAKHKWILVNV